jgi:hypothetical protein
MPGEAKESSLGKISSNSTRFPPQMRHLALRDLSPISSESLGDNLFKYRFSDDDAKEVLKRYYSDEESGGRIMR